MESEVFPRNASSLKSNKSFDLDNYLLNRLTGTNSEFRNFETTSLKSLTVPVGSTDGKKIVKRSETSPEELLNLPIRYVYTKNLKKKKKSLKESKIV